MSTSPIAPLSSVAGTGPVLRAIGLSRHYGDRRVLTDLSVAVDPGHRLGLVGENGIGKSTLLRLLAGVEEPDNGQVIRPADLAYLAQEPVFSARDTVADVLEQALAEVRAIAAELEDAATGLADPDPTGDPADRYDRALARAEAAGVWDADARAQRMLGGLGLADIDPSRPTGTLSGGQRSRLALAAILVRRPGAVLLDEPTNHLDDEAAEFLAHAVSELPGAVVLASHDRVFLDETVTEILDLDPGLDGPRVVGGTYRDYRVAKQVARERWEQRWLAEREEAAQLRTAIADGGKARRVAPHREMTDRNKMAYGRAGDRVEQQVSHRVQDARRRLAVLEREHVPRPPRPLRFRSALTGTARRDGVMISARAAQVPGRVHVAALDVHAGDHLLITGPNGSGKSTLLSLLAGDLTPVSGTVWRAKGASVALLEQDVGLADDRRTPQQVYDLVTAGWSDAVALAELGLVAPRDLNRPLADLSVGQRRRVVLALLVVQSPDVLLLDEPTNHISLALADELGDALRTSPGAVVVASHDRWLRRTWHGAELSVVDGQVRSARTLAG